MKKCVVAVGVVLLSTLMPVAAARAAIIVSVPGPAPHVRVFGADGNPESSLFAYDTRFAGGVRVAIADVSGDTEPELITGAGPGGGPNVHVYSLAGALLADFNAYVDGFRGGVYVAAGDVTGDGKAEIITGPGYGGGPEVRVFNGDGGLLQKWFAYDPSFPGGVHVAAGPLSGGLLGGSGGIVTAPAFGGGPHVRVFNASGDVQREWFAYASGFSGGVNVALGADRVVTAPASNGGPHVKTFDTNGAMQSEWFAYGANFTGGVTVAAGDGGGLGGGGGSVVTGAGRDGGPHVRVFSLNGGDQGGFFAYDPAYHGGVNVATDGNRIVTGAGVARMMQLLQQGDSGPDVADLQARLLNMGYWLPGVDGYFGASTTQAVWAFQKVNGLPRDGKIGAEDSVVLAAGNRPTAASSSGNLVEIDKARQVFFVIRDGVVQWAFNTSTGSNTYYTYEGRRYLAHTPEGRFTFQRQIDGYRTSHLGTLYRPKYFTGGYAIHGSPSIPPYPASHGCVRLANAAIDFIWAAGLAPLGSPIWVHS